MQIADFVTEFLIGCFDNWLNEGSKEEDDTDGEEDEEDAPASD